MTHRVGGSTLIRRRPATLEMAYRYAPDGDPVVIAEGTLALVRYCEAYAA
ncbi:hypothetical protein [Nocardia sp. NPDC057440]